MSGALKLRHSAAYKLLLVLALSLVWAFLLPADIRAAPSEVWVDDDFGPATPGWGTTRFANLADGVSAVAGGGTVHIAAGNYASSLTISKSVRLSGAGRTVTLIHASSGTALTLSAANIVVDSVGLVNDSNAVTGVRVTADLVTVQNSRLTGFKSEAILSTASRQTFILSNDIWDASGDGITIQGTLAATISYNVFNRLQGTSIILEGASNSLVLANDIAQINAAPQWGMALLSGSSINTVSNNQVRGNTLAGGIKVAAPNNALRSNIVSDNSGDGIYLEAGADGTVIDGNTVSGNARRGIALVGTTISSIRVTNNKVTDNGDAYHEPGLLVGGARNCSVYGNQFADNDAPPADNGSANVWYDAVGLRGNAWSDYTGADGNQDGIGDQPYSIAGTAHATDPYPIVLLSIKAQPLTVQADGASSTLITTSLHDLQLRPLQGESVVFRTDIGRFAGNVKEYTVTSSAGLASARLYSDGTAGPATVVASDTARGLSVSQQVMFSPCGYADWDEGDSNPVIAYSSGEAAGLSVLFNGAWSPPYRLWYSVSGGIAYAESYDGGLAWIKKSMVSGLRNPRQGQVLYDPADAAAHFKIWYQDTNVTFAVSAIRYATSTDGVHWTNDQPIAQDAAKPLVTGTGGWNRGTLGPSALLYNADATNVGTDPRNYHYVMIYDATSGTTRSLGLAYSADGVLWKGTGTPILSPSTGDAWDSGQVGLGSVLLGGDGAYRMWYSGGKASLQEGIGAALSDDLVHWTRTGGSAPLFGPGRAGGPGTWNAAANFAPAVLFDPDQFSGNGRAALYKMWRIGISAQGAYAVGYDDLDPAASEALVSGDNQYAEIGHALPNPLVVQIKDSCGNPAGGVPVKFTLESGPPSAQGYQFSTPLAYTDAQGFASTTFSFGAQVGLYKIAASVPGADGSPIRFLASATGGSPATIRLGANPTAVEVGGETAKIIAIVTDTSSNPAPDGTVVTFETDQGDFFGSTSLITSTLDGEATAILASSTHVATATVRGFVAGDSDSMHIEFVAGPPAAISGQSNPPTIAVGGATTVLTAEVEDRFGNLVRDGTAVTFVTDLGSFNGAPSVSTTTQGGHALATLKSGTESGMATVEVRSGTSAYRALHVPFTPDAPKTVSLSSDRPRVAVGGQTVEVTADVRDRFNNRVADGTIVTFSTDLGALESGTIAVATTTNGIARVHLTSGSTVGTAHVRAEAGTGSDQIAIQIYNSMVVHNTPWQASICGGNPLRFSLTVENAGDTSLTNVTFRDTLPTGSYFSWGGSSPGVQIFSEHEVGWSVSSIAAQSQKTLYLEVSTSASLAEGTVITNTLRVAADEVPETVVYTSVVIQCASNGTPSPTPTRTPTSSPSPTNSPSPTPTRTATRAPEPTFTATPTPTPTGTATISPTPGVVPSPTSTRIATRYHFWLPFVVAQ